MVSSIKFLVFSQAHYLSLTARFEQEAYVYLLLTLMAGSLWDGILDEGEKRKFMLSIVSFAMLEEFNLDLKSREWATKR